MQFSSIPSIANSMSIPTSPDWHPGDSLLHLLFPILHRFTLHDADAVNERAMGHKQCLYSTFEGKNEVVVESEYQNKAIDQFHSRDRRILHSRFCRNIRYPHDECTG